MIDERQLILAIALDFAKDGFPVFPVRHRDKRPLTQNGFKDASCDVEQVTRMFEAVGRACNFGIATGGAKQLVVLDFDLKKDGGEESYRQILSKHPELENAPAVRTGGGGLHIYTLAPNGCTIKSKAKALGLPAFDVRGEGGYVVGPGSVHETGNGYEFFPGRSIEEQDLLGLPEELAKALSGGGGRAGKPSILTRDSHTILKGSRNSVLFGQARSLCAKGLTESEIRDIVHTRNVGLCDPPLPESEVDRLLDSAFNYERPDGNPFTDLGNARRLVEQFGQELRFIPERKRWFVWTGTHWGEDIEGRVQLFAKAVTEGLVARAEGEAK